MASPAALLAQLQQATAAPTAQAPGPPTSPATQPEGDVQYTVMVRLPFQRGDFVDPPLVDWPPSRDQALWRVLSATPRGTSLDWRSLAQHFDVSVNFLLQQAAWLYEQQLVQVRAQMRQVGRPTSAGQGSVAPESHGSSGPSAAILPDKKDGVRPGLAARFPSTSTVTQSRIGARGSSRGSRRESGGRSQVARTPLSDWQSTKADAADDEAIDNLAPNSSDSESSDDDDDDEDGSEDARARRLPTRSRLLRRDPPWKNSRQRASARHVEHVYDDDTTDNGQDSTDDADDAPAFLPVKESGRASAGQSSHANSTPRLGNAQTVARHERTPIQRHDARPDRTAAATNAPTVQPATSSMGSSFSDLDEASVTQSAMEEYIVSRMQHGDKTKADKSRKGQQPSQTAASTSSTSGSSFGQVLR